MRMPRWDKRRGAWVGGDSHTLYTFTDTRTGCKWVRPGALTFGALWECATVRVATRAEAEELWQSPLHVGWTVA
jgi:hypothetical protein